MGDLHLSEPMQRYFLDFFTCCDEKKAGKVHVTKLIDVLKTGGAPDDIITQISTICSLDINSAYLNRRQFCSALKLLAAHQANMAISPEILTSNQLEIPLPRLKLPLMQNCEVVAVGNRRGSREPDDVSSDLIELRDSVEVENDYREHVDATSSTDSEVDSETLSIGRNGSPGASSAASDSPTPTNSVQDRSWAVTSHWQGLVSEEQRQLLGTEEESSDRHSSEEDTDLPPEVWTITAEQREYYTAQFRTLQPDLHALLPGTIARKFFEMSRLHVQELRKIWTLADVTKDGALSLEEFNIAMHLVVLRRNHIELPDVLPVQLMPANETPLSSVTPETEPILSPQTRDNAKEWTKFVESPTNSSVSSPGPKPVNFDFHKSSVETDPKILHPVALRLTPEVCQPTTTSTSSSKQQQQQQPEAETSDSDDDTERIPISPQNALIDISDSGKVCSLTNNNNSVSVIQRPQAKKLSYPVLPIPGALPPPPNTVVVNSVAGGNQVIDDGPVSLPAFPPSKKEKPPPPPPRPFKTHGRSSSLDLNRLNKSLAPPTVPPRVSPNNVVRRAQVVSQRSEGDNGRGRQQQVSTEFANFDAFEQYENVQPNNNNNDDNNTSDIFPGDKYELERRKLFAQFSIQTEEPTPASTPIAPNPEAATEAPPPRKHGAFEIYRKPTPKSRRDSPVAGTGEELSQYELFLRLQEQNTVLLRLCQELSQELADVREQKLALKVRLEMQQRAGNSGSGGVSREAGNSASGMG